jgi:hypothetical protein
MAKAYFEKLSQLIIDLNIESDIDTILETRHFFSGAALYANRAICASWTPVGLAFKLPQTDVTRLIANNRAKPLRYFARGNIKKDYVLFENPQQEEIDVWRKYLIDAIEHTA